MEIISLDDISTYSKCPAYYYFSKTVQMPSESKRIRLIRSVIQKCYLRLLQSDYRTDWRLIRGWVNKEVDVGIDYFNKAQVDEAHQFAEHTLSGLHNWYQKVYLKEDNAGYADVKLSFNAQKFRIEDTLPIVRIGDIPTIITIDDVEIPARQLYNSFKHRGYAWLFSKEVEETTKVRVEHLSFGPQGSFQLNTSVFNAKDNVSTEQRITNILYCMNAKVNYPSITSMCNTCQFRERCYI